MGSVENEQNCWRYYGVAHWRQEHTVQWRVSTCSQWKVKPASCWFYPINDLSGFDTFISFPLSNLLGELRWAVMLEKMLEPSVLAGKEESDCFPFFWISLWNASRKEMWEGNSYWGRKDNKHPLHCKRSVTSSLFSSSLSGWEEQVNFTRCLVSKSWYSSETADSATTGKAYSSSQMSHNVSCLLWAFGTV